MKNIRIAYINEWDLNTVDPSSENLSFPGTNTQKRHKTRGWRSNYGSSSGWGKFLIDSTNNSLYFDEGAGTLTATIPAGVYNADTLSAEIETQMEASGTHSYTVNYNDADNKFEINDDTGTVILVLSIQTDIQNNSWYNVAYGNGLFFAVSGTGTGTRVITSPDGINWTTRTSAADNLWRSVVYGNGMYVAVAASGTGNRAMSSPDGINWTIRTTPADNSWHSVTWGNNLFVAVSFTGTGDRVMTSPDGITWTSRVNPVDNSWYGVTFGNNLFVAVAWDGSGNRVMTSPDGINWTIRSSSSDSVWYDVAFGNNLFVAVSSGGAQSIMTSPDGINWTNRSVSISRNWHSITYGGGLFVAVAFSGTGNRVMTSSDGITWTASSTPADNSWRGNAYGNGIYVAVSTDGSSHIMYSTNGTEWVLLNYAVWDMLGFITGTDTASLASHIADNIRIHTSEEITIDAGSGNTIDFSGSWIYHHNLSATSILRFQASNDDFFTIPLNVIMTPGSDMYVSIFEVLQQYRYIRFKIIDVDNSDGYIELGRCIVSDWFEPDKPFNPKNTLDPKDPSLITESEGGQVSSIRREKYRERSYEFDIVTASDREIFDTIFDTVGYHSPIVVLAKKPNNTTIEFEEPEKYSYYCALTRFKYKKVAGLLYGLKISIKDER